MDGRTDGRREDTRREAGSMGAIAVGLGLGRHHGCFDRNILQRKHNLWEATSNMGTISKEGKTRRCVLLDKVRNKQQDYGL